MNFQFTNAFFESMSGITTTGSTIIPNLEEIHLKRILLMESNSSMVGWYWNNCHGDHFDANNECWWYAIIQNFEQ